MKQLSETHGVELFQLPISYLTTTTLSTTAISPLTLDVRSRPVNLGVNPVSMPLGLKSDPKPPPCGAAGCSMAAIISGGAPRESGSCNAIIDGVFRLSCRVGFGLARLDMLSTRPGMHGETLLLPLPQVLGGPMPTGEDWRNRLPLLRPVTESGICSDWCSEDSSDLPQKNDN
jgi:hypothetical protein